MLFSYWLTLPNFLITSKSNIMANRTQQAFTIGNNEGQKLSIAGNMYRVLISGKQTGGSFAVIDMLVPPGGGPGPHAHPDFQESFYVVDGEVAFKSETGGYTAKKGAFINIPLGGLVHGFKNTTAEPAHLLCTVVPAGLEAFFMEIAKPVEPGETSVSPGEPGEEEKERLKAIAEKYGQRLYPPDYLD
jgi:quercetin dioxygenase-like cupin family protein